MRSGQRQHCRSIRGRPRLLALAAALTALLVIVCAGPQHVLEDTAAGPSAAVAGHPTHIAWEHHGAGHVCAEHCAAHVLGEIPAAAAVARPAELSQRWPSAGSDDRRTHADRVVDPPPRA